MTAVLPLDGSNSNTVAAATGVRTGSLTSLINTNFSGLDEPSYGPLAYLFPGKSTFHQLYQASHSDIAEAIVAIAKTDEKGNVTDIDQAAFNKIGNIIMDSYVLGATALFFWGIMIVIIIVLIAMLAFNVQFNELYTTYIWYSLGVIGLMMILGINLAVASGTGKSKWRTFTNDFSTKMRTKTLPEIIKSYDQEEENEKNRAATIAAANATNRGYNNNYNNRGSLLGNIASRIL